MAKKNTVIKLTDDDYKSTGGRRLAPGGTYTFRISKESKAKQMNSGNGAEVRFTLIGPKKYKKHVGVNVFDNIAPSVTWKIAQILQALGIKKKEVAFPEGFLKLIKGKEIRASIRVKNDEEWGKQNKINQYLPPEGEGDEGEEDENEEDDDLDEDGDDEGDNTDDDADEDGDDDDDDADEDDTDDADDDDTDDDDDDDEEEEEEDLDDIDDLDDDDEDEDEPKKKAKAKKKVAKKPATKRKKSR